MYSKDILKELLEKKGAKNVKASKKHRKIKGLKKSFTKKKGGSKQVIVKVLNGGNNKGHGHNKHSLRSCLGYIEKGSIDNVLKDNEGKEWTKEDLKQLVNTHALGFKESSYNAKKKNRLFTHFSFSIPPDISNYCNHSRTKLYTIIEIATVNTINKKYPDYNFIYATHDNTADDKNKNIHTHVVVLCEPKHKETGKLKSNKEDIQELREIFNKELALYNVKLKASPFKDKFKDQRKKQKTLYQFKTINALENKCPIWVSRKDNIKSIMLKNLQNQKNTDFVALLDKFKDLQAKFATVFYNPKDKAFEKFLLLYQENSQMAYWIINKNPKLFGEVTSNTVKLENFKDELDNLDISKFKVSFEYTKEINKPYKYKISETFKEKTPFWFANRDNIANVFIKNNNNPNFDLLDTEFKLMKNKFNSVFIAKEHNAFAKFLLMYQESPKTAHWVINNNPKTYGHITSNKNEVEALQKAILNWPISNFNICFEYVKYIQTEYNYNVGEIFEERTPIWFANKNNIENIKLLKDNNSAYNFEVLTKEFADLKAKFDDIFVNQDHQAFEKFLLMYQENPKMAHWSIKSNPKVYGFVTTDSKELERFQTDIEKIDFSKFKVTFNFIKKIKIEYPYAIKKSLEYNCPMWLENNKHIAKVTIKNKDGLKHLNDIKGKFNEAFIKPENKALEKFLLMYQENYKTAVLMLKEQPQIYGSITKDQTKIEILQKEIETLPISHLQVNFKFSKQAKLNYQSYIDKDFIEKTPIWFANKDNIKKVSISSTDNGIIKDIKLKFNNIFIIKEHNAFDKFLLMYQENSEMAYKAIKNTPKIYGLITTDDNKLKQFQEEITKLPINKLDVLFKFTKEIEVKKEENLNNKENDFETSQSNVSDKFKDKSPIWFANRDNISSVTLDKNKNPNNDFNVLTKEFVDLKAQFDDVFTNKENQAFEKFLLMYQEKPTLAKWIIKNNPTMYGLVTLDKYKLTSFQNNIENINFKNFGLKFNFIKDIEIQKETKDNYILVK